MTNRLARVLGAIILAGCACATAIVATAAETAPPAAIHAADVRERINIDKDWRFAHGHAYDAQKDFRHGLRPFFFAKAGYGDGPASADFSDAAWRKVDLPHDWAVELPFDARADTNHGSLAIGRNFPENSVGWYRKVVHIPASDKGRRISLEFDGVYRNSTVWVNGHFIGNEPSGYSGFRYDITDYLNVGGANVIAVRADATVEEGWFYEGAGIYRHVWLTKTAPLHVAQWGTFVKPTVDGDRARVEVDVTVANDDPRAQSFTLRQEVFAPDGQLVARGEQAGREVGAAGDGTFSAALSVPRPRLWSLEEPSLYTLKTTLLQGNRVVDSYDTRFGIRTVVFDPDKGFSLNGKPLKLQGTNNHQDHAGVGVALPDGLQTWRLKQLKSFGVNAYRASHHPPTPELLDAADRLGMLVIDEHRMMGTTPQVRGQLERMIRRDRNHPSVVIWSVGNEEWALEWNDLGAHLAREMGAQVRRLDPTRRTIVATSGSGKGVSLGADVIGFNYGAQHDVDRFHRDHPDKPALMSEEGSTFTTRGIYFDEPARSHLNAYDRQGRPGSSLSIEEGWRRVRERDWMAGMFVWTGFDYRGETTPFGWPAVSSQFGMIDTTGVLKDSAYYLKSVWTRAPMVHILPHWNWAGREGQPIKVAVYSNGEAVELFQDGRSLGRQTMVKDGHLEWTVPYRAGKLTATAYRGGAPVATAEVATTGAGARVALSADKGVLKPDGTDIAVVWVNVADAAGAIVPTAGDEVGFAVSGPIRIIGVGNGDPGSHEADRPAERHSFQALSGWRTLAVDRADDPAARAETVDTSAWRDPAAWLPPEAQPAVTSHVVLRGRFARPVMGPDDRVALFIDRLGPDQKVYVNGRAVEATPVDGGLMVALEGARLKEDNSLAYVLATPEGGVQGMFERSVGASKWGVLRVTAPAAPWRRRVFNGWAQVIVQSTGEAGEGVLTATSGGLAPATLRFQAR
ncbi:MAG TPA: beta-galactosidase GalA [Duganella sp.]|uniref:beta-galactosidase GalA n=1 Tax=Duganella sp. TaxID=1904440 RepID=UPI002ED255D6